MGKIKMESGGYCVLDFPRCPDGYRQLSRWWGLDRCAAHVFCRLIASQRVNVRDPVRLEYKGDGEFGEGRR